MKKESGGRNQESVKTKKQPLWQFWIDLYWYLSKIYQRASAGPLRAKKDKPPFFAILACSFPDNP